MKPIPEKDRHFPIDDYLCDRCQEAPCVCDRCSMCGGDGEYEDTDRLGRSWGMVTCCRCGGTGKV